MVNFEGPELHAALNGESGEDQKRKCRDFFLHLALCHTVVAETVGNERRLSAASPDEAALTLTLTLTPTPNPNPHQALPGSISACFDSYMGIYLSL